MKEELKMTKGNVWTVSATEIAMRVLGRAITNTAMLGAVTRATGVVKMESIEKALHERFPETLAEKNMGVIKEAYKEAKSQ
jgi:pyruvate ferredoxin oxidoreductase gamma subunit/2-oxoisovalerate ferredoxin oxidoreductase gamma subunit